ncbi:MAG: SDR family NAD(P)-dependent oxidoreductase [Ignavibacteriales bacterium]|nr:SDR family NAD(P)-dependent oxidoreductase [Ignavibacteriales bacterium]
MAERAPVVWVTGASRGIGASTAIAFARIGASVVLTGRHAKQLRGVAARIKSEGGTSLSLMCDVRSAASVSRVHRKIDESVGAVDVLVNNAGVTYFTAFESTSIKQFDNVLSTNLRGTFLCTQRVIPDMLKGGRGYIINIISVAATTTFMNSSVYAASKAGILAMSRGLRAEVRKRGIRVIDILPGAVDTDIWHEGARKKYGEKMMNPDDVGDLIVSMYCQPPGLTTDEIVIRSPEGDL